jgi:hypothetical protein
MSVIATALIAFAAALGPSDAIPGTTGRNAAMVSSCRFRDGQSAHMIVPIGSPQIFVSIRNRAGTNDLSSIEYGPSGAMDVDTNGGVAKIQFVVRLMNNLMRGPFEVATKGDLHSLLTRKPRRDCGMSFQLSPK